MKKISLIALFALMMTVVSFQGTSQENNNSEIVIIRMVEYYSGDLGRIVVTPPQGNSYEVELDNITQRKLKSTFGENAELLQNELKKWRNRGFQTISMSTNGD